jgi:hypothetical protein
MQLTPSEGQSEAGLGPGQMELKEMAPPRILGEKVFWTP